MSDLNIALHEHDREMDKRFADQERIDVFLANCDRDWKAQAVLEQIQADVDTALGAVKRACSPPEGCSADTKHGFYVFAANKSLDVMLSAQSMILMLYQLNAMGMDLEKSEQFRELLDRAAAEELGIGDGNDEQ